MLTSGARRSTGIPDGGGNRKTPPTHRPAAKPGTCQGPVLIACYTGLAYSDIKELKKGHIVIDSDGSKSIHKARQKTDIMSLVPLLPAAERYS